MPLTIASGKGGTGNGLEAAAYRVDPMICEGCGLCPLVCPVQAIQSERNTTGTRYVSGTAWGPMVHARLGTAEAAVREVWTRLQAELAAGMPHG